MASGSGKRTSNRGGDGKRRSTSGAATARKSRSAATKRAAKSAKAKPDLIPQPHGGALLSGGVPGNKGGTGRPPNWLKDWCDDLLANPEAKKQVEAILKDRDHSAYASMWKAVADRAHGKPRESVDVNVKGKVLLVSDPDQMDAA